MPYASLESLPDNIKKLSVSQQETWRGAWNGRYEDCKAEGGSERECESSAFAVANSAMKKDLTPDEAAKFYNGMVEGWDIWGAQFEQNEVNYNSLGATTERGCANCRWFITPGACIIVSNYPDAITPNGISDKWEAKKIYVMEPLPVVIVETQDTGLEEKATKKEGGVEYPASDYAVVPDAEKPSEWKLRLAEGSAGNQTVAQVGRAITALQPSGFRGQKVQLTSEQKSGVIRKISGAIGRISGATADQKRNLRERLDAVKSRTVQVSVPERLVNTVRDAIKAILGQDESPSPFTLYKDADGNVRWFAWASNRYRDRDNPPEILSDKAHQDFVDYVDRTGHFPEAWLWHTPGTKWGKADWIDYADGFLMVSGKVDPGMEHIVDTLALQKDLGVSHGFRYLHSDVKQGIIGWYRSFEVSPLPLEAAANPWTSLEVLEKELENMFSSKKRAFLVEHLGEEEVKRLENDTEGLKAALDKAGIESKDVPEDDTLVLGEEQTKAIAEEAGKAAALAILETESFKGLVTGQATMAEEVKGLAERIAELEKTDDEKIAATISGTRARPGGHQASASEKNTLTDAEAEKEAAFQGPSVLDDIMEGLEIQVPTK